MKQNKWQFFVFFVFVFATYSCSDEALIEHKGSKGGFDFFPPVADSDEDILQETGEITTDSDTEKTDFFAESLEEDFDTKEQSTETENLELDISDSDKNFDAEKVDLDRQETDTDSDIDDDIIHDQDKDLDRDHQVERDRDYDRDRDRDHYVDNDINDRQDSQEIDNNDVVLDQDFDDTIYDTPEPDDEIELPACTQEGALRCFNNNSMICQNGEWQIYRECAPGTCYQGYCGPSVGPCPEGQSCEELYPNGLRGCVINQNGQIAIPPGNQTGCSQQNPCQGNFNCYCVDQNCTQTVCIENCGTCPGYLDCEVITQNGIRGCIEISNGNPQIPDDAKFGCRSSTDCPGNFNCYCLNPDCSQSACIGNCSDPNYPPSDGDADLDSDNDESDLDLEDSTQITCLTDSDCPYRMICSAQQVCVPDCTFTGCEVDEGRCNPITGHCEWCNPPCQRGESCNYSPFGWYCGAPCVPPCPEGFACSRRGQCVELQCPRWCPPGYYCSGSTGYVCVPSETEPESPFPPSPPTGNTCLPPMAPCIEGISDCCSGACVMGNCL